MNTKKMTLVIMPLCGTDHPHIGVGYLTAYLEQNGYIVVQSDFNLIIREQLPYVNRNIFSNYSRKWSKYEEYNNYIYPIIEPYMNEYADNLARNDSGIIGFSSHFSNIFPVLMLAEKIKNINPEKIILIGGPEASEKYINYKCIDFIVPGEGEITLLELMDSINGSRMFNKIKGLIYRAGNRVINTGERPFIENLDMLPFPVFQNFSENKYNYECIPIAGSRGCINRCSFCTESRFWKCFRSRSGESIFNEFVEQRKRYGIFQSNGELREFAFMDSLINANMKELMNFCNLMIENKINSPWVGKVAVSENLTKEAFEIMKKAGCKKLMFGIESGSTPVLEKMQKKYKIPTGEKVLKDAYDSGIEVMIYILIGFPNETYEDFVETKQFILRNKDSINEVVPGVGCQVEKDSDIFMNRDNYGICWDETKEKSAENWFNEFSSYEIRVERVNELVEFCKLENISVITTSLEATVPQLL
jgi:anaerobic magnesium-protoporphyrin IX monomethyl ester cyclase